MKQLEEERLDELLRALAHPDRRQFLSACVDEAVPAGELAGRSSLALASVSEHLKVLRKTGLLVLQKDGRYRLYQTDKLLLAAVCDALKKLEG